MGQLPEELYDFVEILEPKDMNIHTKGTRNAEEAKKTVLRKSYKACVPVYVAAVHRFYLAIRGGWLSEFVGNELGKVYIGI